jgi:hypothetical protein
MWTNKNKIEKIPNSNKVGITLQYLGAIHYLIDEEIVIPNDNDTSELYIERENLGEGLFYVSAVVSGCLAYPKIETKQIPMVIDKATKCEDLGNPHSTAGGSHHGYYNNQTKEAIGTFYGNAGEVLIEGEWKPTVLLGSDVLGNSLRGYKQKTTAQNKIALRSKEGCPIYEDSRVLEINGTVDSKLNLNLESIIQNIKEYSASPSNFRFIHACNIKDLQSSVHNYVFGLANPDLNISFRLNLNGSDIGTSFFNSKEVRGTIASERNSGGGMSFKDLVTNKDFILEIKDNKTGHVYCYVVRGYSAGGHFASIYTITCVVSGSVYVSSFMGDNRIKSYLTLENGKTYESNSIEGAGQSFYIQEGLSHETTKAWFGFENEKNWIEVKLLNENN